MFYRKAMKYYSQKLNFLEDLLMTSCRSAFKIQTHAMFLDTSLNLQTTVLSTIYQNLTETAMKYYRYAKAMGGLRRLPASLLIRKYFTAFGTLQYTSYTRMHPNEAYAPDRDDSRS